MSKHTPGPWEAHSTDVYAGDLLVVGNIPDEGISLEESEANARLIAAAPELLDALKALLARDTGGFGELSAAGWKALEAIRKAEAQ